MSEHTIKEIVREREMRTSEETQRQADEESELITHTASRTKR